MLWIFVRPDQLAHGRITIAGPRAHHLTRVLRVRPGERGVAVCQRVEHVFEVDRVERDRVLGRLLETRPNRTEPSVPVTLLQAILPHAEFDAVLEAATALGVSRFIPVRAARSVARPAEDRSTRWRAIVESAAEQSHRGEIPEVLKALSLAEALASCADTRLLVLDPSASASLREGVVAGEAHAIAIGPEGGWTEDEVERMLAAGALRVGLGPRILRARLAGIAAAAILMDHAERSRHETDA